MQNIITPEEQVKMEIFDEHLKLLADNGVSIWENPINIYDEDSGMHPSPTQTTMLLKFLNSKVDAEWKTQYLLPSATDEVISLSSKFQHVNSLYKYGCGACESKEKNSWYNVCNSCKDLAKLDDGVKNQAKQILAEIALRVQMDSPTPGGEPDKDIRCDICNVIFHELQELKDHYRSCHPDCDLKFKRGISSMSKQENDAGKRGRKE